MKKFLSLVLALVMTMSLVTVSAGAKEFKDDADITYDEAVAVISEIGVVDGYTDGDFRPTAGLSRGAAAKIICNLILGPTTASELRADTAPFKDVPVNHDFAGYIAYCAKEGIISGYGDGAFRPTAPLTGYAFMKMLLGALGYDSTREGYTGANWSINVAKRAINAGLNKGLEGDFDGAKNVNREEAALYAFNTLQADMVEYGGKVLVGDVAVVSGECKAMQWQNSATRKTNIKDDEFVQFAEQYFPKLEKKVDTDDFMRPAHTWLYKKEDLGTYVDKDKLKATYTAGVTGRDIYDLLSASVIRDNDLYNYVDGDTGSIVKNNLVRSNNNNLAGTGKGVLTEVYLDSDKDVLTIVSINTWLAQATSDYNEKSETASLKTFDGVTNTTTTTSTTRVVDVEDVPAVADLEKDDFVLVNITYKENNKGDIVIVKEPEVLSDVSISKFTKGTQDIDGKNGTQAIDTVTSVTVGGDKYDRSAKAFYDASVLNEYNANLLTDSTYNVFVDEYGYEIGVELYEGTKSYVFITGYDRSKSNLSIKTADAAGIFLDGSMKVITVNVTDTDKNIDKANNTSYFPADGKWSANPDGRYNLNRWYTYTEKNGVYTLKPVDKQMASAYSDFANDYTINCNHVKLDDVLSASTPAYGEDASIYITVDQGKVDTTNGADKAITDVTGVYTGVQDVKLSVK